MSEDAIQGFEKANFEDFGTFKDKFMKNLSFEWLIQGHLTQEDAIKITQKVESELDYNPIKKPQSVNILALPQAVNVFKMVSKSSQNPNSCITSYFQLGPQTFKQTAILKVMTKLLDEPFFNQLRTKEQLGYLVFTQMVTTERVLGAVMGIQSGQYSSDYLEWRINEFLKTIQSTGVFAKERVENVKQSLLDTYNSKIKNLQEEQAQSWSQIQNEIYDFNAKEIMKAEIKKVEAS